MGRAVALVFGGVDCDWLGREGAGLRARFERMAGSLGGLRDVEDFPTKVVSEILEEGFERGQVWPLYEPSNTAGKTKGE